ncbi:MAG: thermonuclease family protein [Gammaproteobacteria bacterium]
MHKLLLGGCLLLYGWQAHAADVYRWHDQNGRTHFSDKPRPGAEIVDLEPGHAFSHIARVYDGDTVLLADGRKVRLLGINTPEVEGRNKTEEAGGEEARRWMTEKFNGVRVRLAQDVEKRDNYGRTLAHLFTEQQRHINLELVKAGLAAVTIYPPNLQYTDALVAAQDDAEKAGRGIWSQPAYAPKPAGQISGKNYKGWQRIVGRIIGLRQTRKFVYLELNGSLDARIERKNLALFPDLSSYRDKTLELRGWLNKSRGRFSMLIRHPSAIKILSAD